jgi:hypothetical protein
LKVELEFDGRLHSMLMEGYDVSAQRLEAYFSKKIEKHVVPVEAQWSEEYL